MPQLKETSPLAKRIRQLEALALELGLTLNCDRYDHQIRIHDTKTGLTVEYRDLEQGINSGDSTTNFPHDTETHIVVREEDWVDFRGRVTEYLR